MMKLRMCCRSPSVWNSRLEPPWDALAAAARTGAPSLLSASTAMRIRMKRRTMSSSTCTTSAPSTTRDSMSSVSVLRLVRTRSDTLNR